MYKSISYLGASPTRKSRCIFLVSYVKLQDERAEEISGDLLICGGHADMLFDSPFSER